MLQCNQVKEIRTLEELCASVNTILFNSKGGKRPNSTVFSYLSQVVEFDRQW